MKVKDLKMGDYFKLERDTLVGKVIIKSEIDADRYIIFEIITPSNDRFGYSPSWVKTITKELDKSKNYGRFWIDIQTSRGCKLLTKDEAMVELI